jgi:hypothetical protein
VTVRPWVPESSPVARQKANDEPWVFLSRPLDEAREWARFGAVESGLERSDDVKGFGAEQTDQQGGAASQTDSVNGSGLWSAEGGRLSIDSRQHFVDDEARVACAVAHRLVAVKNVGKEWAHDDESPVLVRREGDVEARKSKR